ncbi:MAG TPA: arginine--tRNA ligase [Pirellulales bacterium]|nr:arginine--tRNA ligase [Pirellulales bacterium]
MNILAQLQRYFREALADLAGAQLDAARLDEFADMVRPSQDRKFGDYQANFAMPLGKLLGRPAREVATQIVERLNAGINPSSLDPLPQGARGAEIGDMCLPPEIAGPGFINLRLRDDWIVRQVMDAAADPRLGIAPVASPRTYIIDYSAPNVAKPMHVGHIRSTVIGAALYNTLKYLGHTVISDNHIGDWGTQFGMILFGYKHFLNREAYEQNRVAELGRNYRLVNRLVSYFEGKERLPVLGLRIQQQEAAIARDEPAASGDQKAEKMLRQARRSLDETRNELSELQAALMAFESDKTLSAAAAEYPNIGSRVLEETAKLHAGDIENRRLWEQFLPACRREIEDLYQRLDVRFDETLGESQYEHLLAGAVQQLLERKIARTSEGAAAVFFDDTPDASPFLVQKKDGAFLYATTDLATIQYRMNRWHPDAILYVVDHRQSLHFEQLFKTVRIWLGLEHVELMHISFGTVLGDDGKPFKTRSGDTVGLSGLLDEAVSRALAIVSQNDDAKPGGPELPAIQRREVAEAVGIGAIKYADLSQNRTSDYVFSYDKMLAMNGNTATYMQYAYARVRSIFAKGQADLGSISIADTPITIDQPAERALALELLRFGETLAAVVADYRPNHLTNYLFALANRLSTFYERCHVLRAETPELKRSRLALCHLTAGTLQLGLKLLGIKVVEKM